MNTVKKDINYNILKKIEEKYAKKITKEELKEIIEREKIREKLNEKLAEIEVKTKPIAKKFAKFTKKMDGKNSVEQKTQVIKFVKQNVKYFWDKYIKSIFPFIKESEEFLIDDVYYVYIFGFFVTLHSRAIKRKEKLNVMSNGLAEMYINTEKVKKAMKEYVKFTEISEEKDSK